MERNHVHSGEIDFGAFSVVCASDGIKLGRGSCD